MRRCLCLDSAPLLVSAGYSAKHIISQISRISATLAEYKHFRVRCRTNEHVITRIFRILLLQLSVYACLPLPAAAAVGAQGWGLFRNPHCHAFQRRVMSVLEPLLKFMPRGLRSLQPNSESMAHKFSSIDLYFAAHRWRSSSDCLALMTCSPLPERLNSDKCYVDKMDLYRNRCCI